MPLLTVCGLFSLSPLLSTVAYNVHLILSLPLEGQFRDKGDMCLLLNVQCTDVSNHKNNTAKQGLLIGLATN